MQHITRINNFAAIQLGLYVDIIDLAILDFIESYTIRPLCPKKTIEGKEYFLLHWQTILKNIPLIKFTSRHSIYRRMQTLKDNLLIMPLPDNQINGQDWYCYGDNFYKYFPQE